MIVSSCGTRISFGSCDHQGFDKNWGGLALNACINKRVTIIIRSRNDLESCKYRVSYSQTELCDEVESIKHPLVREALKYLKISDPLEIIHISDVPAQLGLATSSAMAIALLKGLLLYKNSSISPEILFNWAYNLERNLVKQPGGYQDYACVYGGINLLSGHAQSVNRIPVVLDIDDTKKLEEHLLLIYTGNKGDSANILEKQLQLLHKGATIDQTLQIKRLVKEMHALLLQKPFDPLLLSYPLKETWELKKLLAPDMTGSQVEAIEKIVVGVSPNAGLRLIGSGGNRGMVLVLTDPESKEEIKKRVHPFLTMDVEFDFEGATARRISHGS
jgi:D-glycero-alpha-D-manno-heptose-7-phosphate kinase